MNTLIQLLDKNYELYDCRTKETNIIMEIGSKTNRFFCPYCGNPSDRVHSRYQREVQEQYEEVVKKYSVPEQLYASLKEFHEIMFSKKPEKLGKWLENMGNGWKTWENGYSGNFIVCGRNEKRYQSSTK